MSRSCTVYVQTTTPSNSLSASFCVTYSRSLTGRHSTSSISLLPVHLIATLFLRSQFFLPVLLVLLVLHLVVVFLLTCLFAPIRRLTTSPWSTVITSSGQPIVQPETNQSVGRSILWSVIQSVVRSIVRSVGHSVFQSVGLSVGSSVVRSVFRFVVWSVGNMVFRSGVRSFGL